MIYLTFDDGPGQYTEELLKLLDKYGVKVTFFVCGTKNTYLYRKIQEAGHAIGAHCMTHNYDVVYESDEAYFADLTSILDLIYENDEDNLFDSLVNEGKINITLTENNLEMFFTACDNFSSLFLFYDKMLFDDSQMLLIKDEENIKNAMNMFNSFKEDFKVK